MKTEPNDFVHPTEEIVYFGESNEFERTECTFGLTKREHMAIEFTKAQMIGIISASGDTAHGWKPEEFAISGLAIADALISKLNEL